MQSVGPEPHHRRLVVRLGRGGRRRASTYAALGSDTGGSIRLPAHFCGVTGFKPTNGRVSRANAMPLSFTLDTVGPLARTAEDCALIAAAIAGPDPLDPTTAGAPAWDAKAAQRSPKGLKIGVPTSFYVDDLEPDVAAALDADDHDLAQARRQDRQGRAARPDRGRGGRADRARRRGDQLPRAVAAHARRRTTAPQVRNRLENGLAYSAVEYLEALRWRGPALAAHLAAIGDVDVVIAPASRAAAPTIEETDVGGGPNAEAVIRRSRASCGR